MKNTSGRIRRLLALLVLATLALVGTASAASAAPYGTNTVSVSVSETTSPSGQVTVTVTISDGLANTVYTVVLHSTPTTLGMLTTDASGNASGSFAIPAGFTGAHEVLVTAAGSSSAAASTGINLPASGSSSTTTGGSGDLAFTGAAVIGLGVLAVALLGAGGMLLFVGRRRVERAS